ncbi:hypothetical protein V6N13_080843 [Hibiscus sabdariffa]|uniref:Uncharacterized protein n=2 Tax=Hibiscus sabdariffa TaxID=183260 RepID=A0ABR2NSH5_9ROSI
MSGVSFAMAPRSKLVGRKPEHKPLHQQLPQQQSAAGGIMGPSALRLPIPPLCIYCSQEIFRGSKVFRFYVIVITTIRLFLQLAHVLGGFARGNNHDVRMATPRLFLLSFQKM